jgi:diaminopropionate ammonia-lyase
MPILTRYYQLGHCHNPRARADGAYGKRQAKVLSRARFEEAHREISTWPGYAPTPLIPLPGLAASAGVGAIWHKDESGRFGLKSFKALGGAYAVFRLLVGQLESRLGISGISSEDLRQGRYRAITQSITVTCATDGNHGRSVAWGAQMFGCLCVIYIHATVSEARKAAIESFGAIVVRTKGNYDESVSQASEDAAANGCFVVSDTSYQGYMDVPRDVMQAYAVMVDEVIHQLPDKERPSHIFVQGGVGGLAAAVTGHLWETWGDRRPRVVVVEPEKADCLYQSATHGRPTRVRGDLDTIMAGLACGEVSLLAWEILDQGAADFLTVPDEVALECMGLLANGVDGDPPVVAGESAVAGLAGLLLALDRPETALALGLNGESRVLLFGTEGDTDAELYRSIVGRSAEAVRSGA